MAGEVQDIIDELVTLQQAVPVPAGEADVIAYDEQPARPGTLPAFVNVEQNIDNIKRQSGVRQRADLTVEMQLLFAPVADAYSQKAARAWVQAVLDHFDQNEGLNSSAHFSKISRVEFDNPVTLSEGSYLAVRFTLNVTMLASTVSLAV